MEPEGFWTSDDLGHQTQSMMRVETFDDLIKPYYGRVGDTLQELGIHWWLHSCGNNAPLMPFENIDAFLDEAVRYGAEHRERYGRR